MSEQEIREGMLVAVWDEPPLNFDPDALMARAEKFRTRRRALVGAGVATALVVVSAFALPTLLTRTRPDATVASQPTGTSEARSESAEDRERRLGGRLVALMAKTKPVHDVAPVFGDVVPNFPGASGDRLNGLVLFTDDIGPTAISFRVGKPIDRKNLCTGATSCVERSEQDGSTVVLVEYMQGPDVVQAVAMHARRDGTAVTFSSYAYNPATGSGYRKTVPLGPDALSVLATDSQISWD